MRVEHGVPSERLGRNGQFRREHSRIDGELCRSGPKPRPGQLEGRSQKGEAESDRKPNWNDGTPCFNASHAYAIAEPLGEGVTSISTPQSDTTERKR